MTDATFAPTDGLRARNKLDKLRRIKDAAQRLFIAKGFDDTTMREIAVRAGVGLGTIFLYAKDKRDLLFLTINEPLQHITQQAEGAVDPASAAGRQPVSNCEVALSLFRRAAHSGQAGAARNDFLRLRRASRVIPEDT